MDRRALILLAATVGLFVVAAKADTTATWNGSTGNWSDLDWGLPNYPQNNVPAGAMYDAVIGTGNVTLDVGAEISNLTLTAGTLTGTSNPSTGVGMLTVDGNFDFGGTLGGSVVVETSNLQFDLNGRNVSMTGTASLENTGSATWTSTSNYSVNLASGASYTNMGTLSINTTNGAGFSGGTFHNAGSLTKVSSDTNTISSIFNNTGSVSVQSGELVLNGGDGNLGTTGSFDASQGATISFTGGFAFGATSSITGAGTIQFSGGTSSIGGNYNVAGETAITGGIINFNSAATTAMLNTTGGTTQGTGTLNVGVFDWNGGTIGGGVSVTADNLTFDLTGKSDTMIGTANLTSTGFASWISDNNYAVNISTGNVYTNQGAMTINTVGGSGWSGGTFNNTGNLNKISADTNTISAIFNNSGIVNVQAGTLQLTGGDGGGPTIGWFDISAGAALNFGGSFALNANSSVTGDGNVLFSAGTTSVAGTYELTGATSITAGTVNFNSAADTGTLNISFGTVGGTGSLTSAGLFTWSGGMVSTSLTANGGIDFAQTHTLIINGGSLTNPAGQIANLGSDGNIYLEIGSGGVFNNAGTLNIFNGAIYNYNGSNNTLNNTGTVNVNLTNSGGTFTINSGLIFNNSGSVNVQAGTLVLAASDNGGPTTGAFNISSGTTLNFAANYTLSPSSSISGAGAVQFSSGTTNINGTYSAAGGTSVTGGTVNFNTPATVASLNFTNGAIGGTGNLTASGLFTWSRGTLSSNLLANGGIDFAGSGSVIISGGNLTNPAGQTATIGADGNIYLDIGNGGIFKNAGIFIASNGAMYNYTGSNNTFNNTGTFNVNLTNPAQTFTVNSGLIFDNSGTVNVQAGNLTLNASDNGGPTTGSFKVSSGTALNLANNYTLGPTSSISGAGAVQFSSGTINVNGTYTVAGNTSITGGTVNFNTPTNFPSLDFASGALGGSANLTTSGLFTWTKGTLSANLTANAGIYFQGSSSAYILGGNLTNPAGQTATFGSDGDMYLQIGNGGTFTNAGTFTASDGAIYQYTGTNNTFNNTGTFNVNLTNPTGTFTINSGPVFNSSGTVNVQQGTLTINANVAQLSGSTLTGGAWNVSNSGTLNLPGSNITTIGPAASVMLDGTNASFPKISSVTTNQGNLTVTGGNTLYVSQLSNSGSVTVGPLSAVLSNPGSASGTYTQTAGATVLNGGTLSALGAVQFQGGALSGSGTVSGNTTFTNSTLAPTGVIAFSNNLTLSTGSSSTFQISGTTAGTDYGQATVAGTLTAGGNLTVLFGGGFTPTKADSFTLFTAGQPVAGQFSSGQRIAAGGHNFLISCANNAVTLSDMDTVRWGVDANGDWGTASNWNINSLPLATDDVIIDRPAGVYTVTISSGTQSVNSVTSNENLTISGGTLSVAAASQINGNFTIWGAITGSGAKAIFNAPVNCTGPVTIGYGQASFNSDETFNGLTLAMGDLSGSGNVTLTGSSTWSGGSMYNGGRTIIATGATMNIDGLAPGTNAVLDRPLQNDGSITWTGGYIEFGPVNGIGTISNNGTFTAESYSTLLAIGSHSSNAFLNVGHFVKQGAGLTRFAPDGDSGDVLAFSNSGTMDIQAGTLQIASFSNSGKVTIDPTATFEATAPLTNIGTIDLAGGTLLLDQGVSSGDLRQQLFAGFDNGTWLGTGITSSLAAANPAETAVGYKLVGSQYTIQYTWIGDANLDGVVNSADLSAMSISGTKNADWFDGDFNYDGVVDADDYAMYMLGYTLSGGANISTTLPEPGIAAMGLLALALPRRKRCKS